MSTAAAFLESLVVMAVAVAGLAFCVTGLVETEPLRALGGLGVYLGVWAYCGLRLSAGHTSEAVARAVAGEIEPPA